LALHTVAGVSRGGKQIIEDHAICVAEWQNAKLASWIRC
jgi:hypothetical protein